jgi:hypothetical protein
MGYPVPRPITQKWRVTEFSLFKNVFECRKFYSIQAESGYCFIIKHGIVEYAVLLTALVLC